MTASKLYVIKDVKGTRINRICGDSTPKYLHQDDFGTIKNVPVDEATKFTEDEANNLISAYKYTALEKEVCYTN